MEVGSSSSSTGGGNDGGRKWENLPYDVLAQIFSLFCMADVFCNVSMVCKSWHAASVYPVLWKMLDLDIFYHEFIRRRNSLSSMWMTNYNCSSRFHHFFRCVMMYNGGDFTKLLLPSGVSFRDVDLIYMAQRSPNLQFLYIPPCPMITEAGLAQALGFWSNLKSVSISYLFYRRHQMFQFIGQNCKNITSFKFAHHSFNKEIAISITTYLPGLKILTLLCFTVKTKALKILFDGMENLEELYISDMIDIHCLNSKKFGPPLSADDQFGENGYIFRKFASRLKVFHYCRFGYCVNCPTAPNDNKLIKG